MRYVLSLLFGFVIGLIIIWPTASLLVAYYWARSAGLVP